MKTQAELRADFERFMAADMLDEAEAVLDLLEPLSDEEWRRMLDEAPLDDEPLTDKERIAIEAAEARWDDRHADRPVQSRRRGVWYDGSMKTQDELRADLERFLAADMLDEAEAVLDLLEPATDEEWRRMLDEAPLDDEPLTDKERSRLAEAAARRERRAALRAG